MGIGEAKFLADFDGHQNVHGSMILIHQDNFSAMSVILNEYSNKIDRLYRPTFNTEQDFLVSKDGMGFQYQA